MTVLEGKGLSKRYARRGAAVNALSEVSFRLEEGEILGVVGESGSGKSTLLRLVSGLEAPDAGSVSLRGSPLRFPRGRQDYRAIQMIFQDAVGSFHPRRTVEASIREAVHNLCGSAVEPDLEALCGLIGLDPALARRYPRNLSGGQCQRFAVARAVAVSPQILLCDEITSALDVSSQALLLRLIRDVCLEKGISALFVSHDLAVVSCLCDRVLVMYGGAVVEEGPVREIIERPKEDYTKKLISSVLDV